MAAFIFDMDGTLLNSELYIKESPTVWVQEDLHTVIPADLLEKVKPMRRTAKLKAYMAAGLTGEYHMEEALAGCNKAMDRLYQTNVRVKPYVRETLALLQRQGIPCCVATSSRQDSAEAALSHFHLAEYFQFVQSGYGLGKGKEDASFFLHLADRLACKPQACTVVEDSLYAIKVAKAAGMRAWGIYDPVEGIHRPEMEPLCDRYFSDFQAIYQALNK